jgi:hypothetical protein
MRIKQFKPILLWLVGSTMVISLSGPSSYGATSTTNDRRLTSASELVAMLKYDMQLQDMLSRCNEVAGVVTPESYLKSNPDIFNGIAPGSILWPQVVGAFREFYTEACGYIDTNMLLTSMAQAYSSNLTERELAEVIKFYSSPVGNKLIVANVAANIALQRTSYEQLPEVAQKANAHLIKTLADLAEKNSELNQKPWWRFW